MSQFQKNPEANNSKNNVRFKAFVDGLPVIDIEAYQLFYRLSYQHTFGSVISIADDKKIEIVITDGEGGEIHAIEPRQYSDEDG